MYSIDKCDRKFSVRKECRVNGIDTSCLSFREIISEWWELTKNNVSLAGLYYQYNGDHHDDTSVYTYILDENEPLFKELFDNIDMSRYNDAWSTGTKLVKTKEELAVYAETEDITEYTKFYIVVNNIPVIVVPILRTMRYRGKREEYLIFKVYFNESVEQERDTISECIETLNLKVLYYSDYRFEDGVPSNRYFHE